MNDTGTVEEIVAEHLLRIRRSRNTITIPYRAVTDDSGDNHGYFDLVAEPELITNVVELNHEPELVRLVAHLNSAGSSFETARIIVFPSQDLERPSKVCALGFRFRDADLFAEVNHLYVVAARLQEFALHRQLLSSQLSLLEIQPAHYIQRGQLGFIADLYLCGTAADAGQAANAFSRIVLIVEEFFRLSER